MSPATSSSPASPKNQSEWLDMMMHIVTVQGKYETEIRELAEQVDELTRRNDILMNRMPKIWIRDNLEEAQQIIDNIVGIKGITEDPIKAAIQAGISYAEPATLDVDVDVDVDIPVPQEKYCHDLHQQHQQHHHQRVSISSSIVPSNEELYGY
jgi:hypothetical protein